MATPSAGSSPAAATVAAASSSTASSAAPSPAPATRSPSVDGRLLESRLAEARGEASARESAASAAAERERAEAEAAAEQERAEAEAAAAASAEAAAQAMERAEARLAEEGVLPESAPVRVSIPAVGIDSELLHLGLRDDGSLAVPPGAPGSPASWYTHSPTPGERGPAVLLGHVSDTAGGDGVFAHLSDLGPGDRIAVTREDGTTAEFEVVRGEQYDKGEFPTDEVYGNTDDAQLRVITCDGYNPLVRRWEDNYVVYARLVR